MLNKIIDNVPKQCIIFGGGHSITEGIVLGMLDKIKDKFIIGCNYAYKYCKPTLNVYVDKKFQEKNKDDILGMPLVIAKEDVGTKKLSNVHYLSHSEKYNPERTFKNGIYHRYLTGLFALTLGIKLLDEGEIFLLGFDSATINKKDGARNIYSNNFHGIDEEQQKSDYNSISDKVNKYFDGYKTESKVRIYNVNPNSKINIFEKIDYKKFFSLLLYESVNNTLLRNAIELVVLRKM